MKILIVKMSALGDIIHLFPTVEFLKQQMPEATIDWVVEASFADLLETHPLVDRLVKIDTKRWRKAPLKGETWKASVQFKRELQNSHYDLLFDFQGNCKSAIVTALAKADRKVGFSRAALPEWPNLLATNERYLPPRGKNIRSDYFFLAKSACQALDVKMPLGTVELQMSSKQKKEVENLLLTPVLQGKQKVLVCPGAAWKNKQLELEDLSQLLKKLGESAFLFAWGSDEELAVAQRLQKRFPDSIVIPKLPLPLLQGVMAEVDLVVAMDSLPLHLAGTTKTPTYSFFGPSNAEKYRPLGSHHFSIQGSCPYGITFEKRCPRLRSCPTGACLKELNFDVQHAADDS